MFEESQVTHDKIEMEKQFLGCHVQVLYWELEGAWNRSNRMGNGTIVDLFRSCYPYVIVLPLEMALFQDMEKGSY